MLLATSLKRSCLAKKTIIVKNVTVNIEPLMRMRKAVFKNGHAKIVYVMNGWNRFKAAKATLALVGTVREAAGFPKE